MSKSTRRLVLVSGGILILALILAAVFPAVAQDNSTEFIDAGETLGEVFGRFSLTEDQIQQMLTENRQLALQPGQTVTFPQGIAVTGDPGEGTTTQTPAATEEVGVDVTGTPEATLEAGALAVTETPAATVVVEATATQEAGMEVTETPAAGVQDGDQALFVCNPQGVTPGQTYVTQSGDTLDDVLTMMGLADEAGAEANQPDVNQVVEFVHLNCDLAFTGDQILSVPAGIPQTGQTDVTQTPLATDEQGGILTQTPQAGTTESYTIQEGDTLLTIAQRYGITVEQLLELNPDLLQAGTTLNVPTQQGAIPPTGEQQGPDLTVTEGLTLGELVQRYNLAQTDLRTFFNANRDLRVAEGQTVRVPQGMMITGGPAGDEQQGALQATETPEAGVLDVTETPEAGALDVTETPEVMEEPAVQDQTTYVTQAGDTLGMILDNLGFDLTMVGDDAEDQQEVEATVTPEATDMAGDATQGGTDAQLQEFVTLNSGLRMTGGQTVTMPEGMVQAGQIPQTGAQLSPWGGSPDIPGLNLELNYDAVGPGQAVYVVQSGDTLSSIARRLNVDVAELWAMNPSIENPNVIYRGQRLVIPTSGEIQPGNGVFTQDQLDQQFATPQPSR